MGVPPDHLCSILVLAPIGPSHLIQTSPLREVSGGRAILLPEIQVSKEHLDIKYDRRRGGFVVIDRGSRNGTFLNDNRLSEVSS